MNDSSMQLGKRAFAVAVAAATILWSVGISAFVAPLTADAATPGTLVKGTTLSTVYYYGSNGSRYAFPNEKTYFTWYSDFAGVQTISDSELASIPLAGNIVYRPGSRWIKIQSDPKTYVVTPQGQIRWVESEAAAMGLAGDDWNMMIDDVPDVFFVDYTVGASLTSAADAHNGALVSMDGNTYLVWDGAKRMVTSAGFTANRYQTRSLLDGSGITLAGLTAGSDVAAMEPALVDPAQLGGVTTEAGLTVSLASDSPAAMTVPASASSVTFMKFNLTASDATTVNSITVRQGGVGGTTNVSSVYLYEGSSRLTNGRSINSSTRETTFSNLNLALGAGQTRTLSLVVDMSSSPTSGDTMLFEIPEASDVVATATVSGSFPVQSATMLASSTTVGELEIDKNGSITSPTLGTKQAKIGQFKLTASSTEGVKVNSIRLDVRNASDHENYKLYQNDVLVANGVVTSSDKVLFTFTNPHMIEQGGDDIFEVKADVGGQNGDTIKIAVDEDTDINATGTKYGFGVSIDTGSATGDGGTYNNTGGNCTSSSSNCSYSTIQGGKATLAFNGPTASNFSEDQNGVNLFNLTITSENDVQVRQMQFDIAATGTGYLGSDTAGTANYQNFRLVNAETGLTVAGPEEFDTSTTDDQASNAVTFPDDWNMSAGESIDLMLLVDAKGDSTPYDIADGDTIKATLDVDQTQMRDSNNDDLTVGTDIIPNADLAGNLQTVDTASLTISLSQPPASATHVKGAQNVDMAGLSFTAGSASDIRITDLTLNGYGDTDASFTSDPNGDGGGNNPKDINPKTYFTSCSVYDSLTGGLVAGPESFTGTFAAGSGLDVTFDGFSWTVPAGETYKLVARCNLANVDPADDGDGGTDADDDVWAIELNHVNDVTAIDNQGSTLTTINGSTTTLTVNTTPTVVQTVTTSGKIYVDKNADSPSSTIVLGQSTGVTVSKFKLKGVNESFTVKKLTIANDDGSSALLPGVTSVKIEYPKQDGTTGSATGILNSSAAVTFEGLSMHVPQDDSAILTVKVDTGAVTSDNGASGDALDLELSFDETAADEFEAVGTSSGTTLKDNGIGTSILNYDASDLDGSGADVYVAANAHVMRKTKPTFSLASGSPSGASVPGFSEVLRFNISADSRGYVTINDIMFDLTSTNLASGGTWNHCGTGVGGAATLADDADWNFYDLSDPGTYLDETDEWVFYDTGSASATCEDGTDFDATAIDFAMLDLDAAGGSIGGLEIGAGETKTYVLELNMSDASAASDDSVRVDIPTQASAEAKNSSRDAVLWEDDAVVTSDIEADYIGGLPVRGGTLTF